MKDRIRRYLIGRCATLGAAFSIAGVVVDATTDVGTICTFVGVFFVGWTVGSFVLAEAVAKDVNALLKENRELRRMNRNIIDRRRRRGRTSA